MSKYDPEDYSGIDWHEYGREEKRREAEAEEERREALAQEAEEERARELAFRETPFCEEACYDDLSHTAACQAINSPVASALAGWRRSQELALIHHNSPQQREAA